MIKLPQHFLSAFSPYHDYWAVYGGWRAILKSPYVLIALALTIIMSGLWTKENWWDNPLSVLPNLVGFTLSGVAVLTGWSNNRFVSKLMGRSKEGKEGPFVSVVATFTHFLLVQIIALLLALIAKSRPLANIPDEWWAWSTTHLPILSDVRMVLGHVFWFFSFAVFVYAILLTAAATVGIFWFARWSDRAHEREATEHPGAPGKDA